MKSMQFLSCIKVIDPTTPWLCLHCRYFKRCAGLAGLLASCLVGWIPGNGLCCIRAPFFWRQFRNYTAHFYWFDEVRLKISPQQHCERIWRHEALESRSSLTFHPDCWCCHMEAHSASSWLTPGLTFEDEEGNLKVESKQRDKGESLKRKERNKEEGEQRTDGWSLKSPDFPDHDQAALIKTEPCIQWQILRLLVHFSDVVQPQCPYLSCSGSAFLQTSPDRSLKSFVYHSFAAFESCNDVINERKVIWTEAFLCPVGIEELLEEEFSLCLSEALLSVLRSCTMQINTVCLLACWEDQYEHRLIERLLCPA